MNDHDTPVPTKAIALLQQRIEVLQESLRTLKEMEKNTHKELADAEKFIGQLEEHKI